MLLSCLLNLQILFLVRGPLYLVCISSTDEPYVILKGQLELLHGQVCGTSAAVHEFGLSASIVKKLCYLFGLWTSRRILLAFLIC